MSELSDAELGYAQGLRLAAEALMRHGIRAVGVEDPGSTGVVETLRAGGLATVGIPVDADGLDVAAIPSEVGAVAVTPAHQFPTGAVLAPGRRAALLAWAATRRVVIEDDYDAEYRYDRSPVGALQGLARPRRLRGQRLEDARARAPARLAGRPRLARRHARRREAPGRHRHARPRPGGARRADRVRPPRPSHPADRPPLRHPTRPAARRGRPAPPGVAGDRRRCGPPRRAGPAGAPAGGDGHRRPRRADERTTGDGRELEVVPLAAYAQGGPPRPGLVVGYGAVTPDQVERGIAPLAAALPPAAR